MKVVRIVTTLLLLMGSMLALDLVPPASADPATCVGNMHDPHVSTGGGGIVAKGDWKCTYDTHITFALVLYVCPEYPRATKNWVDNNCTKKGTNGNGINVQANVLSDLRYVPRKDVNPGGAHGNGYWIALNVWQNLEMTQGGEEWSNVRKLSA